MWAIEEKDRNGNWTVPQGIDATFTNAQDAEWNIRYLAAKEGGYYTDYRIVPTPLDDRTIEEWRNNLEEFNQTVLSITDFLDGQDELTEDELEEWLYRHVEATKTLTAFAERARVALLMKVRKAAGRAA